MANRLFGWFSIENPGRQYPTNEQLFAGLARQESAAIVCVQDRAYSSVQKIVKNFGLPLDKTTEILNKSTVIFLQKIADGSYQFQGHSPLTYLIQVARNVAHSATREQNRNNESLEKHVHITNPETENIENALEANDLVRHLLSQLGEPCAQIIRLQHIEGLSDEEVVHQNLTKYSTRDSLKMKRRDCMKKLVQLAQQWKTSNNI